MVVNNIISKLCSSNLRNETSLYKKISNFNLKNQITRNRKIKKKKVKKYECLLNERKSITVTLTIKINYTLYYYPLVKWYMFASLIS